MHIQVLEPQYLKSQWEPHILSLQNICRYILKGDRVGPIGPRIYCLIHAPPSLDLPMPDNPIRIPIYIYILKGKKIGPISLEKLLNPRGLIAQTLGTQYPGADAWWRFLYY